MKSAVYNEVELVLLASKVLGRPVKWTSTRSESFLCDAQARDNVTTAELALDRNGIFLGLRVHTIASIGAYLQTGMPAFTGNIGTLAGVYRTPAIFADVTAVFTHTNPVRPYRGNGRPEAAYVIERLVDLAADELGMDPAELRRKNYIAPAATIGGSAVHIAADRIVAKAAQIAAHLLKVDAADLNFADGVFSSPKTNRTLTIKEVAKEAMEPTNLPKGADVGLTVTATYFAPVQNFPNGCHICELEIDEETGASEIVRYSVVDDVGTVINPLLLKGQIVGGVAQGVGQVLMEDIRFNEDGQNLTASFMDYAMPRATDISAVEVKSNPVPTKTNPLGVKGAGEAGCVGALPAVANALVDALSHLGIRHVEMPATPERLWRAISQANGNR